MHFVGLKYLFIFEFPGILTVWWAHLFESEYGTITHIGIGIGIGIGFIDILYHNVIIPNVYRSKTITWNTCCKKNKIN